MALSSLRGVPEKRDNIRGFRFIFAMRHKHFADMTFRPKGGSMLQQEGNETETEALPLHEYPLDRERIAILLIAPVLSSAGNEVLCDGTRILDESSASFQGHVV